jgi:L-aminopeptidase/D-esterase-like protein
MVVNAVGDVITRAGVDPGGSGVGAIDVDVGAIDVDAVDAGGVGATTIGLVVTNARLDKLSCLLVAQSAQDGMARALDPVHTSRDGDAVVAAATGPVIASLDLVRNLAALAVEDAIRSAADPT